MLWQWSTGHEWIPYDLDTTLALEHAYQQHQPELELAHGFFAANPGYSVTFGGGGVGSAQRGRARHVQTNNNSGMRRQVRRLAEDDAEMFRPVSEEERRQAEKCSICQLEFEEEEEAAEEQSSEVDGATDSEEDGGGIEAVTRAASRQAGSAKKSGSVSGNQPLHHSASNAAASVATVAVSATPATACAPSASASPSSADRIVRLAHCAPGHGKRHSTISHPVVQERASASLTPLCSTVRVCPLSLPPVLHR